MYKGVHGVGGEFAKQEMSFENEDLFVCEQNLEHTERISPPDMNPFAPVHFPK